MYVHYELKNCTLCDRRYNDDRGTHICLHNDSPFFNFRGQIGIACRLHHPSAAMVAAYGPVIIKAVLIASYFFLGVIGCCLIPFAVVCLAREFCTINVVELE